MDDLEKSLKGAKLDDELWKELFEASGEGLNTDSRFGDRDLLLRYY
jgi:hypothetical protein